MDIKLRDNIASKLASLRARAKYSAKSWDDGLAGIMAQAIADALFLHNKRQHADARRAIDAATCDAQITGLGAVRINPGETFKSYFGDSGEVKGKEPTNLCPPSTSAPARSATEAIIARERSVLTADNAKLREALCAEQKHSSMRMEQVENLTLENSKLKKQIEYKAMQLSNVNADRIGAERAQGYTAQRLSDIIKLADNMSQLLAYSQLARDYWLIRNKDLGANVGGAIMGAGAQNCENQAQCATEPAKRVG